MVYLDVAEVMTRMAVKAGVYQDRVQDVDDRFPAGLRHVRPDIEILGIFHILEWGRIRNVVTRGKEPAHSEVGVQVHTGQETLRCPGQHTCDVLESSHTEPHSDRFNQPDHG